MPKLVFCENVPAFQYRWTGWKDGDDGAMQQTHPIEAAIWQQWISYGEARIVENNPGNEERKCMAIV